MKVVVIALVALATIVVAEEDACYKSSRDFCAPTGTTNGLSACDAKYGAIDSVVGDLQKFVNKHISSSFDYLLLSTHFNNYETQRNGFAKLFRKFSDEKWNDAIDVIKHITKRGGVMDFNLRDDAAVDTKTYELSEMESLAKALDTEKQLAKNALHIHNEVTRRSDVAHDPEIGQYLEEEFMEKHAKNIRELSGHTNDLSKLLHADGNDNSLSLFLFDEYLNKL